MVIEELLQLFVGEVDAELLKTIELIIELANKAKEEKNFKQTLIPATEVSKADALALILDQ